MQHIEGDLCQSLDVQALLRIAALLTGHRVDAEDLVQEALLRYLEQPAGRVRAPGGFAVQVMRNLVIDYRRHQSVWLRVRPRMLAATAATSAAEGFDEQVADRAWLTVGLARLSPAQRVAVVLRYLEDWDIAAISAAMDRPEPTVRSLIRRGLKRMRVEMGERS